MLVNYHSPKHVYIVCGNTDLRKEIDTLAILIADNFGRPPEKATITLIGFSPEAIGSPSADSCSCRAVFSRAVRTRVVMPRTVFFSEGLFFDFGIFSVVEELLVAFFQKLLGAHALQRAKGIAQRTL